MDSKEVGKENHWMFLKKGVAEARLGCTVGRSGKKGERLASDYSESKFLAISSENKLFALSVALGLLPGSVS